MGLSPDSDSPVQHEKSILMKANTQRPCCLLFFYALDLMVERILFYNLADYLTVIMLFSTLKKFELSPPLRVAKASLASASVLLATLYNTPLL